MAVPQFVLAVRGTTVPLAHGRAKVRLPAVGALMLRRAADSTATAVPGP
ncbi:hypothetical protein [Streptomyces phaeoluteigriseus]|nr:hypothetical protein [Streptomyces phaeoluteigriseus]